MEVASARLNAVLSLNAHSHWALAEQGWLAFQKGDQQDAIQFLEQAVAAQPGDASYHRRLVHVSTLFVHRSNWDPKCL